MQLQISCSSCYRRYRYSIPGGRVAMGFQLARAGWHIEGHIRLCPRCNPTLFDNISQLGVRVQVRESLF
jgi:hypothetical protein